MEEGEGEAIVVLRELSGEVTAKSELRRKAP